MGEHSVRNVFLIDDEPSVRFGLRFLLESSAFSVSEFESGDSFLSWWDAQTTMPRAVIVLDVRMERMSGLQVHDALIERGVWNPVIFLSGHADISIAVEAIKRGAFDFLEKPANGEAMIELVEKALVTEARAFEHHTARAEFLRRWASLTAREESLVSLVAAGRLNKQIASDLNVSIRTVEVFRSRVFEKMGVRSAPELATLLEKNATK
jgi:two-component system, LuxR family, response regulator DctR